MGNFNFDFNGKNLKSKVELLGSINRRNSEQINVEKVNVWMEQDNSQLPLQFKDLIFQYSNKNYVLKSVNGRLGDIFINGNAKYDRNLSKLYGRLNVNNVEIPKELFLKTPFKNKFSEFDGILDFETDFHEFNGMITLKNELGLEMKGEFSLLNKSKSWMIDKMALSGENSELNITGIWNRQDYINLYMNLEKLDLSNFMIGQKPTELSGLLIIDGLITESGSLDQIDLTLEVEENRLFKQGEISVHGQFAYKDSILTTNDQVLLMIDDNYLTLDGSINFQNNTVDVLTDLEKAEIQLVNSFLVGDFVSGLATGRLIIRGDLKNPSVIAELLGDDVIINDFNVKTIVFSSKIDVLDGSTIGYLDVSAENGTWKDFEFENGMLSAQIKNNEFIIDNFNFKNGKDFVQLTGSFDGKKDYKIDRLQIAYDSNYLVNTGPIKFSRHDSDYKISPFELHINDGVLQGYISYNKSLEGHFKMSNFDAMVLTNFIEDKRLKLSGLIFGEVWIRPSDLKYDLDVDISLKDGIYMEESFDEMVISLLYKDGVLHLDDFSMTERSLMAIEINGILPLNNYTLKKNSIMLETNFTNLPIKFVHRFIPNFFNVEGNASGILTMSGERDRTKYKYEIDIENSIFDIIELGNVKSVGSYDGEFLHIENVQANTKGNSVVGLGDIPIDLNLSSKSFGSFTSSDSFNFKVKGDLNKLYFLSPYLPELDSINGNIGINLELNGPIDNLIRNGSISIKNGTAHTLFLNDPITDINMIAEMTNNKLIIENLVGNIYRKNERKLDLTRSNIKIEGGIDFSKFFEPFYNLKVKSDEVSFKTLYLDIDGESKLDLAIVGRDTINITGKIEANDVRVFYEFSNEELGTAISDEKGIILAYKLVIPIRGESYFQNSQVDAKILGELSLNQLGSQEIDFGGQIFVEDGSIFSYKDSFSNLQGIVNFDNKGFNPFIDASASTMIDDERINLRVKGKVENLDIILESESGFSESDILELLTWGKRIEDQEWTSVGFGNQTVSFLGSLLENQLEKNLKESNSGVMNYIDDINISGAMGLLQGRNEDFELTAMRKIGDKTFLNLSYKRSFSLNQSAIGVEYKLNKHFSVVGNIDESGKLNLKYRYRYAY